jgi:putative Mg2+ transporter-C (MgtC) family protein
MNAETTSITLHILSALVAGSLIGLERTFHGRPAGFRTHALVALASSLLMLVTIYQWEWLPGAQWDTVRTDPTRMAQGIMTGIGFLGAGVIYKEGLTVRGLTTAASIWITAVIGILFGIGFYLPATLGTILTLAILSTFRWIENKMPAQTYVHFHISFPRDQVMPEEELRAFLASYRFTVANMTYRLVEQGHSFEYRMVIHTTDQRNPMRLAVALRGLDRVHEFRISPTGN